jgi:hypothetical protein
LRRLRIAEEADAQIRSIEAWWVANRSKGPELFANELAHTLDAIKQMPGAGVAYVMRDGVAIRRILLGR